MWSVTRENLEKLVKSMSTLQSINIYTNNLKELHKKICVNTQISWKAVFVDIFNLKHNLTIFKYYIFNC